ISLGGTLDSFDLANIQGGGQLNLTVAGGDAIVAGELDAGRWNAEIAGSQIPLASFTPEPNDDLGLVGGNVVLSGGDLSFDLNAIVGSGIVGWNLGAGGAQAAVTLAEGRWSADVQQFELPLVPFLPLLPPEVAASGLFGSPKTSAVVGGKGNVGGTIDSLLTANWQNFDANAQVAVGLVGGGAQGDVALKNGRWEANLETLQVPLAPFLPLLPQEVATYISPKLSIGPLVNVPGEPLRLAGSLAGLTPENLFADGAIGFELNGGQSEFLLDGEFDRGIWNARTNVRQLDLNTFFPTEVVSALSGGVATAQIQGQLDGGLSLSGTLRDFTPEAIAAALQPEAIVEGVFELRQFAVNETTFDAEINGQITRTKEGLVLQAAGQEGSIAGERDYLTALFGDTFIPNALETQFDLTANTLIDSADDPNRPGARGLLWEEQTQTVFASAVREGDILNTQVENIPLSLFGLSLPESLASAPIAGRISGDAAIDLATQTGRGNIQIDRPSIGMTRADLLAGTFNYTGKSLTLADTVLNKGVSEYRLAGRVDLNPKDPQFAGSVEIESGQIQDVLATLGWFEVLDVARGLNPPDYTPASELDLPTVGIPDAPLLDQLRRFSEIVELLEQQRAERKVADPLPGLYELEGLFNGRVDVTGSVNTGADLAFALDGGDWGWGKLENREGEEYSDRYRVNQLEVVGSLQDGLWDFSRLDVRGNLGQAAETQLEFAGQIGGKQQSAQFDLVNLPLEFIEQFTEFPLGIQLSGNLNTSTTLAGSFDNPQARGELSIGDGVFNGEALEFGRGSFSFNQARLNFSSQLAVESPDEPIRLRGSIPYEFPGSTVKPETEAFDLEVNVQNEGLSVLNLFNDQAIWESGQGTVKLNIEGERIDGVGYLPQSTIGLIDLENAVFSSPTLPEPLTNVTGTLQLQDNRVIVEELTGQFEKGQVTASGIYPLAFPLLAEDEPPLTVDLQGVELDLKGLYRGGIDGQVIIGGYFLVPEIGGKITLSDGRVMLAEQTATTAEPEIDFSDPLAPVVLYDNLKLRLAPKTQILTPPVLNFLADGELTITGTIEDPRAAGTIFLRQGLVNLFTTQFTLARNYKNTATFLPERGLDPILAVLMRASVQEATRERFSTDPTGTESLAEIEESAIERGTVQTVRIEAKVTGPASELANNLELTSRPARTQSEIVALMGGGFVNTLGRGDTTLAIANLASSVLLTQIQSAVGQTLGLQDFRLFPATNSQTSTLTLGAEIGIDLTEDISTSILRILDSRESTRFNLRYRLSDSVQLRGSTDFDEDHRGEIELQFRF
ncbi:MAG: translocation/assembly module TamB domain-containing protein, partial [Cyanobacteriota bacterium]|nr:translocation/assembly module TamB domain-containing protein [Cyanobacteriota bacterium]